MVAADSTNQITFALASEHKRKAKVPPRLVALKTRKRPKKLELNSNF